MSFWTFELRNLQNLNWQNIQTHPAAEVFLNQIVITKPFLEKATRRERKISPASAMRRGKKLVWWKFD